MNKNDDFRQQLIQTLRSFRGLPVWALKAGEGPGSDIHMQVGVRKLRDTPLADPVFSERYRLYEHTCSLMVRCTWRLELDHGIVCSSRTGREQYGEIINAIGRLEDQVIEMIVVDEQSLDFSLHFLGGRHRLAVFCDLTDPESDAINYLIQIGDRSLTVGGASIVGRTIVKFVPPLRLV